MAADLRLPLVATNDAHYLGHDDHEPHEALLCIGTGTTLDDPKRFRFDGRGFYVKSGDEMAEVFHDHPSAVAATLEIAERCQVEIATGKYHLPEFQVPAGTTREAVLEAAAWAGCAAGWARADEPFAPKHDAYRARMEHELRVIGPMGFAGYFLIVADFIDYARRSGIPVGPGAAPRPEASPPTASASPASIPSSTTSSSSASSIPSASRCRTSTWTSASAGATR